ncbi:MAG TPA: DUF4062 domain-containing protein [Pyrinomonadaceae bacterium]|jgi:hypothetical protein
MARVYISSTYSDLKEHRAEVYRALRQLRHDVIGMEDYVAADTRPVAVCLADVAACDIYVGIFAWRYGYVPEHDNPEARAITELEYRQAVATNKTCLIFLLRDDVPWPPAHVDRGAAGERVAALKAELSARHTVDFFGNKEDLARRVLAAIHVAPAPPPAPAPLAPDLVAGKLVPKLCDRSAQEEEFYDHFTANLERRPGRPQLFVVHGDEGECHDSFVERLVATRVREVAKKLYGPQHSVVVLRRPGWPYEGELAERQVELRRKLFSEFEPAHMGGGERTAAALARLPSVAPNAMVAVQHRINAARWDAPTEELLRWYAEYWAALDAAGAQPQLLVFLAVVYPKPTPGGWWRSWLGQKPFDKARVQTGLRALAATAERRDLPFLVTRELLPVQPDDVHEWFSRYNIWDEKERHDYSAAMFTTADGRPAARLSMKDVEHRLHEIHQSYLVKKGYVTSAGA